MSSSCKKPEIDVNSVIELVKARPCIWCKSHDLYSDKSERRMAWKEVFQSLHEGYDSLPAEERKLFGSYAFRTTYLLSYRYLLYIK